MLVWGYLGCACFPFLGLLPCSDQVGERASRNIPRWTPWHHFSDVTGLLPLIRTPLLCCLTFHAAVKPVLGACAPLPARCARCCCHRPGIRSIEGAHVAGYEIDWKTTWRPCEPSQVSRSISEIGHSQLQRGADECEKSGAGECKTTTIVLNCAR